MTWPWWLAFAAFTAGMVLLERFVYRYKRVEDRSAGWRDGYLAGWNDRSTGAGWRPVAPRDRT